MTKEFKIQKEVLAQTIKNSPFTATSLITVGRHFLPCIFGNSILPSMELGIVPIEFTYDCKKSNLKRKMVIYVGCSVNYEWEVLTTLDVNIKTRHYDRHSIDNEMAIKEIIRSMKELQDLWSDGILSASSNVEHSLSA